ncbi:hypothetical protein [Rhodococcus erythropolis]
MNDEFDDSFQDAWREYLGDFEISDDHMSGFTFDGGTSSGRFLPDDLHLDLQGSSDVEHHVVHLHEIYHKALNEGTAFGDALYFAYKYPMWRAGLFADLQDASRKTHEAFATFMSVSLAETQYPDAPTVIPSLGRYRGYYNAGLYLTDDIDTSIRKELVITAAARVAMQTPILDVMVESALADLSMSEVRSVDRPDHRLAWILRHAKDHLTQLAGDADRIVLRDFGERHGGVHPLDVGVEDTALDKVWDAWLDVVYEGLGALLTRKGASVVSLNGHLYTASVLVRQFGEIGLDASSVHLPDSPESTDLDESTAMLSKTTYRLREALWPATFAYVEDDVAMTDLVDALAVRTAVKGVPELVLHARTAGRLADSYAWGETSNRNLDALRNTPVVVVKVHTNIGDTDEIEVFHVAMRRADDFVSLLKMWADRGPTSFCIAASCFADPSFAAQWVEPLRTLISLVVLLDVPIRAISGSEQSLLPSGSKISVDHYLRFTGLPHKAVVWSVEGQPHVGLFIGDSLSTQLIYSQILDVNIGGSVSKGEDDWSEWEEVLHSTIRSVVSCESHLDLRTFESWRSDL